MQKIFRKKPFCYAIMQKNTGRAAMEFLNNLPELAHHTYKIDYATGNFFVEVNDYAQRDILKDFVITRTYNSLSGEWKFNLKGNSKKITLKTSRKISLIYEGKNLVSIKDEQGRITRYEYDGNFLKCVIYPDGSKVRYFSNFDKQLVGCRERDGKNIFQNEYDDIGRILKITTPEGERKFFYDVQNRCTIEGGEDITIYKWNRRKLIEEIIFSDQTSEKFIYDANRNLNYKRCRNGDEYFWRYNEKGFLRREILPDGGVKKFVYDEHDNIIRKIESNGREELFYYSTKNLLIERKVRLNIKDWRIETFERDISGRVLRYSVNNQVTNYAYDETAPVPSMIQTPCGYKFSCRYDETYRLLAIKTEVGEYFFTYNQLNEPVDYKNIFAEIASPEKNFPKTGIEIYDEGGRLIESRESVGDKFKLLRWKYDRNDNCIERREWEKLQERFSATGRVKILKFEYDAQNRLTKKIDGENFTEYNYDCLNRCVRQKIKYPSSPTQIKKFFYNLNGEIVATKEYEVK